MGTSPPPHTAAAPITTPPAPKRQGQHDCHKCDKTFDRKDHLTRHVASHLNTRNHVCPRCPRRFNRKDLLARHIANHNHGVPSNNSDNVDDGTPRSRPRGPNRASQACEGCVRSKTKCSNQRPCQRCEARGIACRENRRNRNVSRGGSRDESWDESRFQRQRERDTESPTASSTQAIDGNGDGYGDENAFCEPPPAASIATPLPATPLQSLHAPHTPSTDVFHTLWSFAPTNRGHGFGAFGHTGHAGTGGPGGPGGLGDPYQYPYALPFGAGMHDLVGASPSDETMYWDNFNLAPNDLLGMSMGMSHDVDFAFNVDVDDTMQQQHMNSEPTAAVVADAATTGDNDNEMSESGVPPVVPPETPPVVPRLAALSPAAVASGYKAYQRSPWLFDPAAQDHAYAESQALSVDEQMLERMLERQLRAESTEVRQPQQPLQQQTRHPSPSPSLPRPMDATARDAILAMAIAFSKTTTSIRSFPSCDLLNVFVKAYFVREAARPDPWIHAPTLYAGKGEGKDRCRTELLAAVVASGATLFAPPKVWKMGLALQEIVKLAIRSAVDNDNRLTRNLQVFQAFVLWVEIALWSGHRRKMEIGEGFASSIITMLRRAGVFHQGYYAPLSLPEAEPIDGHDEECAQRWRQTWLHWVRQQSFKRLALHLFMTEMRASIAFRRSPMISVAELSFGLPAARDLWDVSDAQAWKARYLAEGKRSKGTSLTVVDGMYNTSLLAAELDGIDLGLGSLAILYGFWCPVWAYLDARATSYLAMANTASTANTANTASTVTTNTAAGAAQRQELHHTIQTTSLKLRSLHALCPEGQLVSEFLMMSLHASFEDMQRFAGRYGVDEFKQALPILQEWAHSDDQYYTAAWHAGQVLRAARCFAPTHLRGFPAVAVYQACLTLLVFAVFSRFRTHPRTHPPDSSPCILLNGEETMDVRTYLRTGHGRPRLLVSGQARDLDNPVVIATAMAETFRSNYPSSSDSLPPLLDSLTSLMGDICKTFVSD